MTKPFTASPPSFPAAKVRPLRTADPAKLLEAVAALQPPFTPEVAAELIAIGYVHADANVRKRAIALVGKHVKDAAAFKAAYKSLAGAAQHVVEERVRAFDHPYRLDIAKAILFHRMMAGSLPFEDDAATRGAMLDEMVAMAKREGDSTVSLGSIYWYWKANGSGWATFLKHQRLPKGLFRELANRRKVHPFDGLSFHGGALTELPDELASAKPWLKTLELGYNPFTTFPEVILELENLETLSLLGTELTDIPAAIASLPKLRSLDLGNGKKMKTIPASVCALDKLESLRIGNGSIRTIPDAIGGMTSLRELEMQSTRIAKLPPSMAKLPNLKRIKMKWSKVPQAATAALSAAGVRIEL